MSQLKPEFIDPDQAFVQEVYETASNTYRALLEIARQLHKAGLEDESLQVARLANVQKQLGHDCLLDTKPISLN